MAEEKKPRTRRSARLQKNAVRLRDSSPALGGHTDLMNNFAERCGEEATFYPSDVRGRGKQTRGSRIASRTGAHRCGRGDSVGLGVQRST